MAYIRLTISRILAIAIAALLCASPALAQQREPSGYELAEQMRLRCRAMGLPPHLRKEDVRPQATPPADRAEIRARWAAMSPDEQRVMRIASRDCRMYLRNYAAEDRRHAEPYWEELVRDAYTHIRR